MVKLPRAEFSADARSQGFDVPQLHAPSAAVGAASVNNRTSVTIDKLIVQSGGDAQDAKALGVAARDAIIRELEAIGVHLGAPTAA
jgi:hypothetical protein